MGEEWSHSLKSYGRATPYNSIRAMFYNYYDDCTGTEFVAPYLRKDGTIVITAAASTAKDVKAMIPR